MAQPDVVVDFTDKYGDKRTIHKTRHGLKLKRQRQTNALILNPIIGQLMGQRIRKARLSRGMTMAELCHRAGISSATPKSRIYEIEVGQRREAIRFGTLFAIAIALDVTPASLMPSVREVLAALGGGEIASTPETLTIPGAVHSWE